MQGCIELHGLSEYIITFLKISIYSDDILKIPSANIFFQGDISKKTSFDHIFDVLYQKYDSQVFCRW
jgi:hypothetical protein